MTALGILCLRPAPAAPEAVTGLDFPSNDDADNDVRFYLNGANLPQAYPATYIWKLNNRQQPGYYTTFFWGPNGSFTGGGYYGFHLYPQTDPREDSTSHKQEISVDGEDIVVDDNANNTNAVYDAWTDKAAIITESGGVLTCKFYWDLSDTSKVITYSTGSDYAASFPPASPALTFGGAPWSLGNECLSGILRGIQVYESALSLPNIQAAKALDYDADVIALGLSPFYLNMNPTPSDITDKSGNGHNPTWANSNRPTLYSA